MIGRIGSLEEFKSEKSRQKGDHIAGGLLPAAAGWQKREPGRAQGTCSADIAWEGGVPGIMQRGSAEIVHAGRGALAFVHLRRIRGSIPRRGSKGPPLRHGALGTRDDGIPSVMGTARRAGRIGASVDGDSEGARIETGDAARKGLRRGARCFL